MPTGSHMSHSACKVANVCHSSDLNSGTQWALLEMFFHIKSEDITTPIFSDGQIPISGNSTERICDPGMSSQIPQIVEYQSMACQKLGPPVLNVAPIAPEGSHSLHHQMGHTTCFHPPPSSDIPCIIYSSQHCL